MNKAVSGILDEDMRAGEDIFQVSLMEEPLHSEHTGMPVLHLLAALRSYHNQRNLSHIERFGTPDPQSRQALSELYEAQQSLQALTAGNRGSAQETVIEASLNLRMAPRNA